MDGDQFKLQNSVNDYLVAKAEGNNTKAISRANDLWEVIKDRVNKYAGYRLTELDNRRQELHEDLVSCIVKEFLTAVSKKDHVDSRIWGLLKVVMVRTSDRFRDRIVKHRKRFKNVSGDGRDTIVELAPARPGEDEVDLDVFDFSRRERELVQKLLEGKSKKELAAEEGVSQAAISKALLPIKHKIRTKNE